MRNGLLLATSQSGKSGSSSKSRSFRAVNLYEDVKKMPQRRDQELPDPGASLSFYKDARLFEDKVNIYYSCQGEATQVYLKACRDLRIVATPLLEKALHGNKLILRSQCVTALQAQAICMVLQASMRRESSHEVDCNPYLVSELIVDNCGTGDEALALLLQGVLCQKHLTSLSYSQYNEFGSASLLGFQKLLAHDTLRELNLTNIKIEQPTMQQLLESLIPVESLSRLRLSKLNLNH